MNAQSRIALLTLALTLVAGVSGVTVLRGEAREALISEPCAGITWPMIPPRCLEGGKGPDVRYLDSDVQAADAEGNAEEQEYTADMTMRFDVAFAEPSTLGN